MSVDKNPHEKGEKPRLITWQDGALRVTEPVPRTFGRVKPRKARPPIVHALAMAACVAGGVLGGWAFFVLALAMG